MYSIIRRHFYFIYVLKIIILSTCRKFQISCIV